MSRTAARKTTDPVAEICLFGVQSVGHGWLARLADGRMLGTGEPRLERSLTEAVWQAADAIRLAGQEAGTVRVFEPSGALMATIDLGRSIPAFHGLSWTPAPVIEISLEALLAGAEAR